jgi:hypothetical protein
MTERVFFQQFQEAPFDVLSGVGFHDGSPYNMDRVTIWLVI